MRFMRLKCLLLSMLLLAFSGCRKDKFEEGTPTYVPEETQSTESNQTVPEEATFNDVSSKYESALKNVDEKGLVNYKNLYLQDKDAVTAYVDYVGKKSKESFDSIK